MSERAEGGRGTAASEGEAGRELDARVAEAVMGWRVLRYPAWTDEAWSAVWSALDAVPCSDDDEPRVGYIVGDGPLKTGVAAFQLEDGETVVWSPSTDIADAFEVVEWMERAGWLFGMLREQNDSPPLPPKSWRVTAYNDSAYEECPTCGHERRPHPFGHAATLPLAICRAALQAIAATAPNPRTLPDSETPPNPANPSSRP